jgi:hypothetical protein
MAEQAVRNGTLPRVGDIDKIIDPMLRQEALDLVRKTK